MLYSSLLFVLLAVLVAVATVPLFKSRSRNKREAFAKRRRQRVENMAERLNSAPAVRRRAIEVRLPPEESAPAEKESSALR